MALPGTGSLLRYRIVLMAANTYFTQVLVSSCLQSSSLELEVPPD